MKIYFFLLFFALYACKSRVSENKNNKVVTEKKDTINSKIQDYFNHPFRDIHNFNYPLDHPFIEKLYARLVKQNGLEKHTKTDICFGDVCMGYRLFENPSDSIRYCFLKSDCGE